MSKEPQLGTCGSHNYPHVEHFACTLWHPLPTDRATEPERKNMVEPLTDAEYEPIRAALFGDGSQGQGASAAQRKIAENLDAAGLMIVRKPESYKPWVLCDEEHHPGVECQSPRCAWNV